MYLNLIVIKRYLHVLNICLPAHMKCSTPVDNSASKAVVFFSSSELAELIV